ncbi:hypothetical protein [Paenibacillus glufosinatiresistens]|uniref:hypothetical protein n=1 Tax=Paenibacillus glufosinatiresistens TaxID=3070657 RepID=UPI00286DD48D|nr:hypothetical protein [Paenibacillus sp. YX.27]
MKDQAGQILYASTHLKETATNAYQMTQQAYTALKQMSPEERARVLGEKAGELAVDALLTKGAGALGKEALNATLETAGTLAQKAGELLPKPGAVLTTPEGIRIPVSEAEADWVRKIEGGAEETGDVVKFSPNNLPKDPQELINNGWKDVTPTGMAKNTTSREFIDPETGMKVRFDPGKPGANGFEGKDHYHVTNPNGTTKADYYLDANGNPVAKGSKASHIVP